ncbi:MAG: diadenylate cyclase [Eubacterium sp.]|nr:diadenylate cyclase [Eubacterium sp.]
MKPLILICFLGVSALFINHDGKCLAIGVIVDGKIKIEGDAGCGARYNSIANYMGLNPNCVGIVVSEDGMVNVIQNTDHSFG